MHNVFFGLEFNHANKKPEAIVWPSVRPGRVTKWVNDFEPRVIIDADGNEVLRERVAVKMPLGFRLRKDEVSGVMKKMKLSSYQDAKFYTVMNNHVAVHKHPAALVMEKAQAAKEKADEGKNDVGEDKKSAISEPPTPAIVDAAPESDAGGSAVQSTPVDHVNEVKNDDREK